MEIILCDTSEKMIESWDAFFSKEESIKIQKGDITKIDCDAIVSPANSFGFMDGGLDYALSERFGWDLEKKLQQKINALPEGELLVGQAMIIETGDSEIPFLISAPTMRVPTNFNIETSINAYLAMKAILIKLKSEKGISRIAIPGLCTGVGRMDFDIAAQQMYEAYKEVILGQKKHFSTFGDAQRQQIELNSKGMIWTH